MVSGKVALVTGAASGIGMATAELLVREGAKVLLCDRNGPALAEAAQALRAQGGRVEAFEADVAQEAQVAAAVEACLRSFGAMNCAVNNAGITGVPAPVAETDLAVWHQVLAVNLTGVFLCLKHEIAHMRGAGGGSIVNVASGSAIVATPGMAAYCASKHGVLGLTKTAAVENAGAGIRVNAVCPGSTDTPMLQAAMAADPSVKELVLSTLPAGRLGRPQEVAEAIVWLCSDRASFVNGATLLVDGAAVAR
ncbi:MAG: glucose 1-dehydrogenase [Candidatus Dadabacteria bacterium]|nr:MAG: glucose 1-dehydrogenase [Candidatus Dadabacteria bacterium]